MIDSPKLSINIWGRDFTLPFVFDCYENETVTKEQILALGAFVSHPDWMANARIYTEEFCKEAVTEDDENTKKDNIFSYIKPECIFVKRDQEHPRVALMCKYRYDMEHGLAVVFFHTGEIIVDIQDIIL